MAANYARMRKAILMIRDVTMRLRQAVLPARNAMLSQSHLDEIVRSAMDAIVTVDDTHAIVLFNPAAEKMFGYTANDIVGCPLSRLLPQRFHAAHGQQMTGFSTAGAVARRMGHLGSVAACRADGTEFAAEASISHVTVGTRVYYTAIVRDISERIRHLTELEASERRERFHAKEMQNILHAVPAAVCIAHDPALVHVTENALYTKWFGSGLAALPDVRAGTMRPLRDALHQAANGHEVRNIQFSDLKADGTVRHLLGNAITVRDDDMTPAGAICAFVDVTDLTLSELNVLAITETSTAKTEYITQMTHELRTPLGTMLGYAQLLEMARPALHADQMSAIRQILKAGWHLRALINEVQQLSAIEARSVHLPTERVDLDALLGDMQAMIAPLVLEKQIAVAFSLAGQIVVDGNLQHCKQVMLNLLSNAIKYNRHGGSIFVSCETGHPGMVRIIVRDTGAGLDASQLENLFQPFNRLGQESGREVGTGVGLIVTKRLVEAMRGTMGVQSTPGTGTSFWVNLPLAVAS